MNLAHFCCFFTTIIAARHLVHILALFYQKRKFIYDIAEIGVAICRTYHRTWLLDFSSPVIGSILSELLLGTHSGY